MIYVFILVTYVLLFPSLIETIPDGWKSSTKFSSIGYEFSPLNEQALFLLTTNAKSQFSCIQQCHSNTQCRILDYDSQSHQCRLFQGNIATMGSIVSSPSSFNSRVGSIEIRSEQYINYNQSCSKCLGSRYLECRNNSCQCPSYTYFDGSICQSQKLSGNGCNSSVECRTDLNYTCLPRMQCGFALTQTATISIGNINGTSGSGLSSLNYPLGIFVALDHSLYVADYNNHRVIKFAPGSSNGTIVAGTGVSGSTLSRLNGPTGVYVDASFNIYVGDSNNYRIMLWQQNASSGIKIAGNGSFGNTLSTFGIVGGIYGDSQGNIYICDSSNHRIMRFSPNTTNGVIVAGITGSSGNGTNQLNTPYGLYLDDINSYLYVADYNNQRIQRFHVGVSTNGTTVAGGNGAGSANNQLKYPYSVCVSKMTNGIYIADSGNNRIQLWNSQSTYGVTIAGNGAIISNMSTVLQGSMDIRLNINETSLFVSEASYNRVLRFTLV